MKRVIVVCSIIVLSGVGYARAGTWTTLDYPGAYYVYSLGISGNNIIGTYQDSSGGHGFLYNGGSWTGLPIIPNAIDGSNIVGYSPSNADTKLSYNLTTGSLNQLGVSATGVSGATIMGVSGSSIIGEYPFGYSGVERGFLWNATTQTCTLLDYPGAGLGETYPQGISGSSIVGYYFDGSDRHGFLYNGTSYAALNYPGASNTYAQGISGNNIVGYYNDSSGSHGFLYNNGNWTTFSYPGASNTYAQGISGNNIVGYYNDSSGSHGFLYNNGNWTTFSYPGASITHAQGISGNNIVGTYHSDDVFSPSHGFIYTIPEPATPMLVGLGGLALRRRRK